MTSETTSSSGLFARVQGLPGMQTSMDTLSSIYERSKDSSSSLPLLPSLFAGAEGFVDRYSDTIANVDQFAGQKFELLERSVVKPIEDSLRSRLGNVSDALDMVTPTEEEGTEVDADTTTTTTGGKSIVESTPVPLGEEAVKTLRKVSAVYGKVKARVYKQTLEQLQHVQKRSEDTVERMRPYTIDLLSYAANMDSDDASQAVVGGLQQLSSTITTSATQVSTLANTTVTSISTQVQQLPTIVSTRVSQVGASIASSANVISTTVHQLPSTISTTATDMSNTIKDSVHNFPTTLSNLPTTISTSITSTANSLSTAAKQLPEIAARRSFSASVHTAAYVYDSTVSTFNTYAPEMVKTHTASLYKHAEHQLDHFDIESYTRPVYSFVAPVTDLTGPMVDPIYNRLSLLMQDFLIAFEDASETTPKMPPPTENQTGPENIRTDVV